MFSLVSQIMVNYTKFPIRSTRHVSSPCDDGYIYIPVCILRENRYEGKEKKKKEATLLLLFVQKTLYIVFLKKKKKNYTTRSNIDSPRSDLSIVLYTRLDTHRAAPLTHLLPSRPLLFSLLYRWHLWGCCIWFIWWNATIRQSGSIYCTQRARTVCCPN